MFGTNIIDRIIRNQCTFSAHRYYEMAYGRREFPATWEECVQLTKRNFGSALAVEFLRNYANKETKQKVNIYIYVYIYIYIYIYIYKERERFSTNIKI